MKFAFAATLLMSTMAMVSSASDGQTYYDVHIEPKCKGVDFTSLTVAEKDFVSDALETTYNQVHQLWDGGEKLLFDIQASATPTLADG